MGITILATRSSTIFWNSSRITVMVLALVHTAARPMRTENTSADMTGMIWGMARPKTSAGSSFSSAACLAVFIIGMRT